MSTSNTSLKASGVKLCSRRGVSGSLYMEEVELEVVAREVGTPTFVYSRRALERAYDSFAGQLTGVESVVCVSVKANSNLSLLSLLAKKGAGFDVVSGGELTRAIAAGADPRKIVFAGVGKTDDEIRLALNTGILMFNVESREELSVLNDVAKREGKRAPVSIRVNPNVDAKTHAHMATAAHEHKFGIPIVQVYQVLECARDYTNIEFLGLDCHIGSNLKQFEPFREAFLRLREMIVEAKKRVPTIRYADVGGGVGVVYNEESVPPTSVYTEIVQSTLGDLGLTIILEPGRAIFGNSGVLLASAVYYKQGAEKDFLIVDAAMNDLIRPALYDAYHDIQPLRLPEGRPDVTVDVVGPICETGDFLARGRKMPKVERGESIAVFSAGAYGFVMSSNYNTRPRAAEVLVGGDKFRVVRPRETVEALIAEERRCL